MNNVLCNLWAAKPCEEAAARNISSIDRHYEDTNNIACFDRFFAEFAGKLAGQFNGLNTGMGNLYQLSNAKTRSIIRSY
ncbi:hypothetical protein D770_20005 [Flammeovirgaceae bacterium 311]|nr:hypothetical protein D770_20005 [Flammeovirgaceae bacterium 311]